MLTIRDTSSLDKMTLADFPLTEEIFSAEAVERLMADYSADSIKIIGISTTDPTSETGATVNGVVTFKKGNVVLFKHDANSTDYAEYIATADGNVGIWDKCGDATEIANSEARLTSKIDAIASQLSSFVNEYPEKINSVITEKDQLLSKIVAGDVISTEIVLTKLVIKDYIFQNQNAGTNYTFSIMNDLTSFVENETTTNENFIPNDESNGYIGKYAFANSNIEKIRLGVPENSPNLRSSLFIKPHAFENCSKLKEFKSYERVQVSKGMLQWSDETQGWIMENPDYREGCQFKNCSALTDFDFTLFSLITDESMSPIPQYCFENTGLSVVDISGYGDSVLLNGIFKNCKNLLSVNFPDNVWELGAGLFENCTKLSSIPALTSLYKIYNSVFKNCSSLTGTIELPNVDTIAESAFYNSGIDGVVLGPNCWTLSDMAFANCKNLVSVEFSEDAYSTDMGTAAFENCTSLVNFKFPREVYYVADRLFNGCSNLTTVDLAEMGGDIGASAFYNCSSLTTINFNSFETYGYYALSTAAFMNCSSLESFNCPNDLNSIGISAFANDTNLTGIGFYDRTPEDKDMLFGISQIGDYAFSGCSNLISVDLFCNQMPDPAAGIVNNIGNYAFSRTGIIDISFLTNLKVSKIPAGCFAYTPISEANVPYGISAIDTYSFRECLNLTDVSLPETCLSIRGNNPTNYPFYKCHNLSSIYTGGLLLLTGYMFGTSGTNGLSSIKKITFGSNFKGIMSNNIFKNSSLLSVHFKGNAPIVNMPSISSDSSKNLTWYVNRGSTGWNVDIPGKWYNRPIKYYVPEDAEGLEEIVDDVLYNYNVSDGNASVYDIYSPDQYYLGYKDLYSGELIVDPWMFPFPTTSLVIPEYLNGAPVTSIGTSDPSYAGMTETVTHISLPNTCQRIESYAFANLAQLTDITIPASVTFIGDGVLTYCPSLSSIILEGNAPDNIADMTAEYTPPFTGCSENLVITIPSGSTGWPIDEENKLFGYAWKYAD